MRFGEFLVILLGCAAVGLAIAAVMGADIDLINLFQSVTDWIEGWGE